MPRKKRLPVCSRKCRRPLKSLLAGLAVFSLRFLPAAPVSPPTRNPPPAASASGNEKAPAGFHSTRFASSTRSRQNILAPPRHQIRQINSCAKVVLPHWRGPCTNTTGVSCKASRTRRVRCRLIIAGDCTAIRWKINHSMADFQLRQRRCGEPHEGEK